jgi:dUTP pyrophosphatase
VPAQERPPVPLKVQRLRPEARLPHRASAAASGLDLFACLGAGGALDLTRDPTLVPTGIALELPPGCEAQVRPRSGLAAQGVMVAFGTIDADYRGELFVTMYVFGSRDRFPIRHGDRIAQLVVARLAPTEVVEVEGLSPTERGGGGYGSTGLR